MAERRLTAEQEQSIRDRPLEAGGDVLLTDEERRLVLIELAALRADVLTEAGKKTRADQAATTVGTKNGELQLELITSRRRARAFGLLRALEDVITEHDRQYQCRVCLETWPVNPGGPVQHPDIETCPWYDAMRAET